MGFQKLKKNRLFQLFTNRYFLIASVFIVWMVFFDENSYLNHRELDTEINELETSRDFYNKEIEKNKKIIEDLKDPEKLEKFAREKYRMKKENEDIYIIEFDTLKK